MFEKKQRSKLLMLLAILGAYFFLFLSETWNTGGEHHTTCPSKLVSGYPCPGCGMGRATLAMFKGNFEESFYFHALAIPFNIVLFLFVIKLIAELVTGKELLHFQLNKKVNLLVTIFILTAVAVNWFFAFQKGL